MKTNRRKFIKGLGGAALALPMLESTALAGQAPPKRLLIAGNPFGAHPDYFFPKEFGRDIELSPTLKSMDWMKERITVLSHTDHNMVSGHGREVAFLSGVLPSEAGGYPDKNMSLDQVVAREISGGNRFPSLNIAPGGGVRMSWTASGVENEVITSPQKLYDKLFVNLSERERGVRKTMIDRDARILDAVAHRFSRLKKTVSKNDLERLDRFETSVQELDKALGSQRNWVDSDKPTYDLSKHYQEGEITVKNDYEAIYDMVAFAFETDLTRVATIAYPAHLNFSSLDGVNRSYHGCTHNGKKEDLAAELARIEAFQVEQFSRCLKKLDSIQEPNSEGTMLDNTVVLFGSGMGYGGTHSNRNLPIMLAGGGFKHLGHVDASKNGKHMPLCNLYLTMIQRFGIEREAFNLSTGTFDLSYA
ncbi:MAG: DUF1552 domain-containing protein [Verrucomicrobiales bacterium]|nr:DUF1552 domain-containing protein [Verrucomicrobiales bacterium]